MLASVDELADFIAEPISDEVEQRQATALLEYASALVEAYVGKTWDEGQAPDIVRRVTVACAARKYTNFDGFTSESIDDWRGSGRVVEEDGLFLTGTERGALDAFKPKKSPLGTISSFRGDLTGSDSGWVPTDNPPHVSMPVKWW